eukprot:6190848-Pleurochrysis_carterae.AAC.1
MIECAYMASVYQEEAGRVDAVARDVVVDSCKHANAFAHQHARACMPHAIVDPRTVRSDATHAQKVRVYAGKHLHAYVCACACARARARTSNARTLAVASTKRARTRACVVKSCEYVRGDRRRCRRRMNKRAARAKTGEKATGTVRWRQKAGKASGLERVPLIEGGVQRAEYGGRSEGRKGKGASGDGGAQ